MLIAELIALVCLLLSMLIAARLLWQQRNTQHAELTNAHTPQTDSLNYKLAVLDINLAPLFVFSGVALFAFSAFLLIDTNFAQQRAVAFIAAATILLGSYLLLNDLVSWRIKQLEHHLIDAMDTMNSAMRSGLSITQAISTATTLTKGSLQRELKEISKRLEMGVDDTTAINRLVTRYNCEGTRLFAQAFIGRQQSDSNLNFMLPALAKLLRARQQQYQQVRSKLSGTRYAALFCGALPYALIPLFSSEQPDWFEPLLQHPNGATYLATALILQVLGFIALRKVLRTSV